MADPLGGNVSPGIGRTSLKVDALERCLLGPAAKGLIQLRLLLTEAR